MEDNAQLNAALKERFGFSEFRGLQLDAVQAVMRGDDALVLMQTGGGKSLCYALPAVLLPGVTLVISPLIALMEDQVNGFRKKGIAVETLNSSRPVKERRAIIASLLTEKPPMDILFVAPELLATDAFKDIVKQMYALGNISVIAVDEAHCISSWGCDFRPTYRQLAKLRDYFPNVPILALTATASVKVQEDIVKTLQLRNPVRLMSSFDRPNIHFAVRPAYEREDMAELIAKELIEDITDDGSIPCTIIYALRKVTVDSIADQLARKGIPCVSYHAGKKAKERTELLAAWSSGKVPVVAATISFGMGIDKPDVRFVYHVNLPKSLENFYQEAGRGGRDGLPTKSICFYKHSDVSLMRWLLGKQNSSKSDSQRAAARLERNLDSFNSMVLYCQSPQCRRKMLLAHFGEKRPPGCGNCDFCIEPEVGQRNLAAVMAEFRVSPRPWKRKRSSDVDVPEELSYSDSDQNTSISHSDDEEDGYDTDTMEASDIASKHRKKGTPAVMDALEEAELHGQSSEPSGKKRKRSMGLSGKGQDMAPKKISLGSPPVSQTIRQAAEDRILKALLVVENSSSDYDWSSFAKELEQQCFAESGSKTVYLGKVASMARAASKGTLQLPTSMLETALPAANTVYPVARPSGPQQGDRIGSILNSTSSSLDVAPSGVHPAATASTEAGEGGPEDLLCAEMNKLVSEVEIDDSTAVTVDQKILDLEKLICFDISAAVLKRHDIGKRVRRLTKHQNIELAKAAKSVVTAWKAVLLKQV